MCNSLSTLALCTCEYDIPLVYVPNVTRVPTLHLCVVCRDELSASSLADVSSADLSMTSSCAELDTLLQRLQSLEVNAAAASAAAAAAAAIVVFVGVLVVGVVLVLATVARCCDFHFSIFGKVPHLAFVFFRLFFLVAKCTILYGRRNRIVNTKTDMYTRVTMGGGGGGVLGSEFVLCTGAICWLSLHFLVQETSCIELERNLN